MIEQVIHLRNMQQACIHVMRNKGSAGVDRMSVNALKDFVRTNSVRIAQALKQGDYRAQPILGVAIPKSNGKMRLLGIPTVTDRWLQQCVTQAITPKFEVDFKPHSYGFRPGKNAHHCVIQAQQYINAGFSHIVDIDLKSFFDEVDHCILLQLLYRKVKCKATLQLIRKWLRAPIMIEGKLVKRRKGVPQGSPLSPLLSNIMLHELDRQLEKRGCKYVRYADDFSIYCKKKTEARKMGNEVFLFLKDKLKLPINREKSGIRRPVNFKLLGYEFVPTYEKGTKGQYQLVVSENGWKELKAKIRTITRKTAPLSLAERTRQLKEIGRGWVNYFRLASLVGKLGTVDSWVRNRLRYCIWKDWKKPERKRRNLMRLGVDYHHAFAWSRTRKGGWAIAQSPILTTTITLDRLAKRGYESLLDYYLKVRPEQTFMGISFTS
ncbi:MAG: group II intron reverse transcriptase/maturase [Flavobacteriales bacterium]|jgi:group II intron reverse transcriptase/maturase